MAYWKQRGQTWLLKAKGANVACWKQVGQTWLTESKGGKRGLLKASFDTKAFVCHTVGIKWTGRPARRGFMPAVKRMKWKGQNYPESSLEKGNNRAQDLQEQGMLLLHNSK
jgi:hypothetical protein